jgi:shikimate dehydrogenase
VIPLLDALSPDARALGAVNTVVFENGMSGGGMALFQAVGAFRLFAGVEPDAERMLRHFASM